MAQPTQLDRIEAMLKKVDLQNQQQTQLLASLVTGDQIMSAELDFLTAQVAENTDTEASAVALLQNLHDLLVAAGTDPVKLGALANTLKGSRDALAAAIVANTPAAPAQ